jgi:hypothetical protein
MNVKYTMSRVVLSLTTTPVRISKIRPVLASLLAQTRRADAIILTVPLVMRRTGQPYTVPAWLTDPSDPDYLGGITVHRSQLDYGPATKLVGALEVEKDDDTRIIYLDDDTEYDPRLVEELTQLSDAHPDATIGYSAVCMDLYPPPAGMTCPLMQLFLLEPLLKQVYTQPLLLWNVPILEGHWSVCTRRRFFNVEEFKHMLDGAPLAFFMSDDVNINAYLSSKHVPRLVIMAPAEKLTRDQVPMKPMDYDSLSDALHNGGGNMGGGSNIANYYTCFTELARTPQFCMAELIHESYLLSRQIRQAYYMRLGFKVVEDENLSASTI